MILAELQSVSKPLWPFHSLSHVYSDTFICMNVNKDLNLDWLSTCLTLAKPNYKASENNELNKTRWLHLNLVKFTFVVLFRFFNLPKATYTILCASKLLDWVRPRLFFGGLFLEAVFNSLSADPTKWSNTLEQFNELFE